MPEQHHENTSQLVPADLLRGSEKILFIAHLALGDFTYLKNCFEAFAKAYPHLEIHLWVDEVRRTRDASQWPQLARYSLYDWVEACPFFAKVYRRTYSPALLQESIREAQREAYPIVISLATLRPQQYAALARLVAPHGFVAGMRGPARFFQPHHRLAYRKLDASIPPNGGVTDRRRHITDVYAAWFKLIGGVDIAPAERFPTVDIPRQWQEDARRRLAQWGFEGRKGRLVFINPFAKTRKRSWPVARTMDLIAAMKQTDAWRDACFIVNAVPSELAHVRRAIEARSLAGVEAFSAVDNFFQLPAMLGECDLIISVETAVMHLANAVHVPVIALMRQKNPEWVPIDSSMSTVITTAKRREWVDAIPVEQVMKSL